MVLMGRSSMCSILAQLALGGLWPLGFNTQAGHGSKIWVHLIFGAALRLREKNGLTWHGLIVLIGGLGVEIFQLGLARAWAVYGPLFLKLGRA